MTKVHKIC